MFNGPESYSASPSSEGGKLPAEGIVIFTASIHAGTTVPNHVRVVINDEDIDQTGIAQQSKDSFSLQLALKRSGVRLFRQWTSQPNATPLYLAIDGTMINPQPLRVVDEDTVELAGMSFDAVYALAVALGYDQEALSELSHLDPGRDRFQPPDEFASTTQWKIVSNSGQFIGDQMDEILTILNNRFDAFFNGQVTTRRVQSAMQVISPQGIDKNELTPIVTTVGQAVIFTTRQHPRPGEPLPADAQALFTQDDIQFATLENPDHVTLVIELNDEGIEKLARFQGQAYKPPLYLALDDNVAAAQNFIVSGDSHLEMDDLTEKDGLFLFTILDNDPLPADLSLAQGAVNLQDEEELPVTWKVVPNDPGFEDLDDIFQILNNRAGMLYRQGVSVERAQSSLRIISAPQIDTSQLLRMTTTLGRASLISSRQTPKMGAAISSSDVQIINELQIAGVSLENPDHPTLVLELNDEGSQKLGAFQQREPKIPLYLALDGRIAAESPLLIVGAFELRLVDLPAEEALFLCAILDNDVLPTSLSISPITISRADESFLRGFNDLWLVKPVEDVTLYPEDWESIRSILTYRIETLLKDATSVEFEGGRLMIIPDLHTDLEDLKAIVTHRGHAEVFFAPFAPRAKEKLPQGARLVLTQDEISSVAIEYDEHDAVLTIKLNVEGARLGQNDFKMHTSNKLYLAIDGEAISSMPLNTDGNSTLFLEGLSAHEASYLAAILDNDILPLDLTLEPLALDQYDQFVPESNQTWYVEPVDENSDLNQSKLDQTLSILNERSSDLFDGQLTFAANDTWGILVQFPGPDIPINLDILEQIVSRQGKVSIFSSSTAPAAGEMMGLSAHVRLTEEHILSAEADGSVIKLSLSRPGKNILASLREKALYLAVDDEVMIAQPFIMTADNELQLSGLTFDIARFLAALMNHDSLPMLLRVNMEEDAE